MTIIYNQPAADYFAIEALSASGAKLLNRSAAHYLHNKAEPPKPSSAQAFGTLVHCLVLEPNSVHGRYMTSPKFDRRTTVGKTQAANFEASVGDRTVVDLDDYQRAQRAATAVREHPTARSLLTHAGHREATATWGQYGVVCKARLDAFGDDIIVDLKTARDASPVGFARAAAVYQYHAQAAHYLNAPISPSPAARKFYFIAVEPVAPFNVAVYELTHNDILAGRAIMEAAAKVYETLSNRATRSWPGYPVGVNTISLPFNGGSDAE